MRAGKTTIGRQLARELKIPFYDSDRVIEEHTGANIPLIFDLEGEEGFRKREQAAIDELTGKHGIVLATGGGAVLNEENRRRLRERGTTFYLYSDLDALLERTRKDKNRPLLHADESPEIILKRLMDERDPLYRQTADHIIDIAPEGGDGGGRIVATGTPEEVAKVEASHTGRYLGPMLKPRRVAAE